MADLALAIDLGGTQIRVGLVDALGQIVTQQAIATQAMAGPAVVLDQIAQLSAQVLSGTQVKGAAICAPGPLDTLTGRVFGVQTLKGFEDFPLRDTLSHKLSMPVQVENDGIAGAVAELCHGAGRAYSDFVYITISTGIGGGIIADGRPLRGRRGMAGHLGHMFFHRDWPRYAGAAMPVQRCLALKIGAQVRPLPAVPPRVPPKPPPPLCTAAPSTPVPFTRRQPWATAWPKALCTLKPRFWASAAPA